jgi:glycosyltransferase involved in cell wall biosynthesis
MAYLINPGGRIVAIDDADYQKWLNTPGFQVVPPEQLQQVIKERTALANNTSRSIDPAAQSVYLSTVSQGGKDGYGVASGKILKELTTRGVNVSTANSGQKIALLFHNPYSILRLEAPYRILYTMFESDKLPDDWREYLEGADRILVPSFWCQQVFKKFGFESEVVPLGYDDDVFQYVDRPDKRETRENFTFLHYNAFNIRKGFLEVFKAFVKAFSKDEPVRMVFKTTLETIPLPITKSEYPNIDIIRGKMNERELVDLLGRSDAFVYPSRGEGFGMTPLEAMATGLPTIVPNAHGISEYFDRDFMYEVKVASECPAIYSRYKGMDVGKMVVTDVDDLARQMRYIYDHQAEARAKGKAASEYVKQWTWKKTGEHLAKILEEADALNLKERPLKNVLDVEVVQ